MIRAPFRWLTPRWQLNGYDTFAGEPYFIGRYYTERCCLWAAWIHLRRSERGAGAATDGGPSPDGVRDTLSVSGPRKRHMSFKTSNEVAERLRALRPRK